MRILMTSILCQSGLMTHVNDLVKYLAAQGIFVAIAFKRVNYVDEDTKKRILSRLAEIPYLLYDSTEELQRFVLEYKCMLIHAHSHATFQSATEVSLLQDIPLVVTLHSVFPWHRKFRSSLEVATKIIAVGPAQALAARGYRDKALIIQNGIDTSFFVPGKDQKKRGEKIHVLWYGRVDRRLGRGLRILDQVAPMLPSNIEISALGSVDFQPRNLPLMPWQDDPRPFLQKSQITFAHGRSLREAMSSGSIGLLLGHGYGGMVTEERLARGNLILDAFPEYRLARPRPATILHDILTIARHPNIEELGEDARSVALRHFDIKAMGSQVVSAYQTALDSPKRE